MLSKLATYSIILYLAFMWRLIRFYTAFLIHCTMYVSQLNGFQAVHCILTAKDTTWHSYFMYIPLVEKQPYVESTIWPTQHNTFTFMFKYELVPGWNIVFCQYQNLYSNRKAVWNQYFSVIELCRKYASMGLHA